MKRCPSCGYDNPDYGVKCHICARDISAIKPWSPAPPEKEAGLMILAGVLLILCGAAFYFFQRLGPKPAPQAPAADDAAYNYYGIAYALDKMKTMRFLPQEDKVKVLKLLSCHDVRVSRGAAVLAGQWAGEEGDTPDGSLFFDSLIWAAFSGGPAAAEAGVQAALLIPRGFPFEPYLPEINKAAAALAASSDPEFRVAGYMLAAMAGIKDFDVQMAKTFSEDPSPDIKLYAACAMARRGNRAGYAHLTGLASGSDLDMKTEALACLAYSAVPGTDAFLASAARGRDPEAAAMAKSVLMSRKQLAIINK
jgi:hypothetical protein